MNTMTIVVIVLLSISIFLLLFSLAKASSRAERMMEHINESLSLRGDGRSSER